MAREHLDIKSNMKFKLMGCTIILWANLTSCKTPLYFGAVLPYTKEGWIGDFGKQSVVGTNLAVQEINERDDILANYEISVIYKDSMASSGMGLNGLYEMLYTPPTKIAFIGELQSTITEALAEVTGLWKVIQVNQASSSPNLSNRVKYPYFFRALGPPYSLNDVQATILKEFNWSKVAVLHESKQPHSGITDHLQEILQRDGVSISATESFYNDPSGAMRRLKQKDVRIIIGNFDQQKAIGVFCNAFKLGMYGPKYVFFIVGYYSNRWWQEIETSDYGCNITDMKQAVEGYFSLVYTSNGRENRSTFMGRTPQEFREKVSSLLGHEISLEITDVTAWSYDIIWALAFGLNSSIHRISPKNLSEYTYFDETMTRIFRDGIKNASFYGASGPVDFTENGDRIGRIHIEQNIGGSETVVGSYYPGKNIKWFLTKEEIWRRNDGMPPFDSDVTQTLSLPQHTPVVTLIFACIVCSIGIILSIACLAFNFTNRKKRIIKMSSPNLNNVIVSGLILSYMCVIAIGVDLPVITEKTLVLMCEIRVWMFAIAFTLSFGGMLTKMWRVYSIVISGKTKRRVIRDRMLIGIVGILFGVDVIILIPRQLFDPFDISEFRIPISQTAEDVAKFVRYELLYIRCTAIYQHIWLPTLISYKAIIILFGAFLSFQTREIKVPSLNDASYVGLSIYNCCICAVVAVPMSFIYSQETGVTYAIVGGLIVFCTTVSLCMLFTPKIIALRSKDPDAAVNGVRIGTIDSMRVNGGNTIRTISSNAANIQGVKNSTSGHPIVSPIAGE